MTAACRLAGYSAQEAFDILGSLLEQRYIQWDQAIHHLPSWGADIDGEVRRYIDGIQNVVQANISWRCVISCVLLCDMSILEVKHPLTFCPPLL
jgi:hypothetical protein